MRNKTSPKSVSSTTNHPNLQKRVSEINSRLERVRVEVADEFASSIEQDREARRALMARVSSAESESAALREELSSLRVEVKELAKKSRKVAGLTAQVEELGRSEREAREARQACEARLAALERQLANVQKEQKEIRVESSAPKAEVFETLERIEAILENNQTQISLLKAQGSESGRAAEAIATAVGARQEVDLLAADLSALKAGLAAEIRKSQDAQKSLRSTVEEFMEFMAKERAEKDSYFKKRLDELTEHKVILGRLAATEPVKREAPQTQKKIEELERELKNLRHETRLGLFNSSGIGSAESSKPRWPG